MVSDTNYAPLFPLGDGIVIRDTSGGFGDYAYSTFIQNDNKILVTGSSGSNIGNLFLLRFNSDGSIDENFGTNGKILLDVRSIGYDVVQKSNGDIVVAGKIAVGSEYFDNEHNFLVTVFNSNGELNSSFSSDGIVRTNLGTNSARKDTINAIAIQEDGKILAVGGVYDLAYDRNYLAIVRYDLDGSLDSTFSLDGKHEILGPSGIALSILDDGSFLVATSDSKLMKFNSNGTIDNSFGNNGVTSVYGGIEEIFITNDDKVIVVGTANPTLNAYRTDIVIQRFNLDGSLDLSFSEDGLVATTFTTEPWEYTDLATSAAIQSNGKILVAGYVNSEFSVLRFNQDGNLDHTFGESGQSVIGGADKCFDIAIQADDRIILLGKAGGDVGILRLTADGIKDLTFDIPQTGLYGDVYYTENASPVSLDGSVKIYDADLAVLNSGSGNYSSSSITLERWGGANTEDYFGTIGNLVLDGTNAVLSGVIIGTFTQIDGSFSLTFNQYATQLRVNEALSSFSYSNTSNAPPSIVQINWTFNDGNTGDQGTGGVLTSSGITTVTIANVNDAPTGGLTIIDTSTSNAFRDGDLLSIVNTIQDADVIALGAILYQWQANGIDISGTTSSTYTLTEADIGKTITVVASYTDNGGTTQVVTSSATTAVSPAANLTLTGTSRADTLTGKSGNDTIDGKRGNDTMIGGLGNDTYVLDSESDVVTERSAAGTDTIQTSVSYTAPSNVENLTLIDSRDINGTGNNLHNILTGNSGNNILNGGAGNDTMVGGDGNDTYIVDSATDVVTEGIGAGNDTIRSSVTYAASNNIEHLTLTGSSNINATGNSLKNTLIGNSDNNTLDGGSGNDKMIGGLGNDTMIGGSGKDTLTGGTGSDTFVFDTTLNSSTNRDTITDFSHNDDTIQLSKSVMSALGALGTLSVNDFKLSTQTLDSSDRIIYNQRSGTLFYDADGSGSSAALQIAILDSRPKDIDYTDFVIV